ncbi:MAG: hypothetical protein HOP14_00975 [Acidobacteria bacterium]|nr:hypothetical protein [Acidobacteriota bacterium]
MKIRLAAWTMACAIAVMCVACGGDNNPAAPTGGAGAPAAGGNSGPTPATSRGTITAQIDGVAFNGIATAATNQSGIFAAAAANGVNSVAFGFGALAAVGTTSVSATSPTNANLVVLSGTTGSWAASTSGGSGSLTISTINATGATGTFSFTLVPVPGTGATGNKSVTNGSFSVTF